MTCASIINMMYRYPKALEMVQRKHSIIRADISNLCTFENWKDIPFSPGLLIYMKTWYFSTFFIVLMYFQKGWWNDDIIWHHLKKKSKLNLKGFHSVQNKFLISIWIKHFICMKITAWSVKIFFLSCVPKSLTSSVSASTQLLCEIQSHVLQQMKQMISLLGYFLSTSHQCGGDSCWYVSTWTLNTGPSLPWLAPQRLCPGLVWWIWPVRSCPWRKMVQGSWPTCSAFFTASSMLGLQIQFS